MRKLLVLLILLFLVPVPARATQDCSPNCGIPDTIVDAEQSTAPLPPGEHVATVRSRMGGVAQDVFVSYRFVDGTAKLGEDYLAERQGTVVIRKGTDRATIPFTVLPNRPGEPKEWFALEITAVQPGKIGNARAVFTIR